MSMIVPVLKVLGTAALVGFGSTALVRVAQRRAQTRTALPPPMIGPAQRPTQECLQGVWAIRQPLSSTISLPPPARMTVGQFPGFALTEQAQRDAMEALLEYVAAVEEVEEGDYVRLSFPGVEQSSIPPDGQEVGIQTALERSENYRRFGAAAAAAVVAPACEWPEPFSRDEPETPKAQQVWRSLEHMAVIALAARDQTVLEVDIAPVATVLEDRLEACIGPGLMRPLRDPVSLAPEIGEDTGDQSWQMTHDAQIQAYQALQAALADPSVTNPITRTVTAVAPQCAWADKTRYGLNMTTMWYEVRRLEDMAYDAGGQA
jgi:hypothetical protein